MERRQYLAAAAAGGAIGVGGVVGYVTLTDQPVYPAPFDPETDQIERSGSGVDTTESFEITNEGPTVVMVNSDNSSQEQFQAVFKNSDGNQTDPITGGDMYGPYEGQKIVDSQPGESYEIEIASASASWDATIYDLPMYERSDNIQSQPPITREDGLDKVLGPIDFGDEEALNLSNQTANETDTETSNQSQQGRRTEFSLQPSEEDETPQDQISYALRIYDNTGELQVVPINTFEERTNPVSLSIANVGFIEVDSTIFWSLSVTDAN